MHNTYIDYVQMIYVHIAISLNLKTVSNWILKHTKVNVMHFLCLFMTTGNPKNVTFLYADLLSV